MAQDNEVTEGKLLGMKIVKRATPRVMAADKDQTQKSRNGLVEFDLVMTYEEKVDV